MKYTRFLIRLCLIVSFESVPGRDRSLVDVDEHDTVGRHVHIGEGDVVAAQRERHILRHKFTCRLQLLHLRW